VPVVRVLASDVAAASAEVGVVNDQTLANRVAASRRCMFGTAASHCGEPATVHVWPLPTEELNATMDCARHYAEWWVGTPHLHHEIGGCCGLPGTTWGEFGCFIEGVSETAEAVALSGSRS
jgi:hypothetical protein